MGQHMMLPGADKKNKHSMLNVGKYCSPAALVYHFMSEIIGNKLESQGSVIDAGACDGLFQTSYLQGFESPLWMCIGCIGNLVS